MKKFLFIAASMFLLSCTAFAQPSDSTKTTPSGKYEGKVTDEHGNEPNDTTKIDLNLNPFKKGEKKGVKNVKTRWLTMLDLGVATYAQLGTNGFAEGYRPFEQNMGQSLHWNWTIVRQRINLIDKKLFWNHALSFEFQHYNFANKYTLRNDSGRVAVSPENPVIDNNRIYTSFITVPLMLTYESNAARKSRSFRLGAGGYGSLMLGHNLKQEFNNAPKQETKGVFNMNQFRYGFRAEIGYGPINFYATYAMNGLFKDDAQGPNLRPMTIGISLLPF